MSSSPDAPPTSEVLDDQTDLRDGYAEVGDDIKLHYVEAGDGPLVVLLHGFPEFWFSWRLQIAPLAAAGFRVVAPDLRGYNLSSRPEGVEAYGADKVADDIRGLIRELGAESALLVGHDFGGTVAWATAMAHPEVVDRLVILNAAHPRRLNEGLKHPNQLRKLWYFFYFQPPGCPSAPCAPGTGDSSGATSAMPGPRTRRRRPSATSSRGHSRAPPRRSSTTTGPRCGSRSRPRRSSARSRRPRW